MKLSRRLFLSFILVLKNAYGFRNPGRFLQLSKPILRTRTIFSCLSMQHTQEVLYSSLLQLSGSKELGNSNDDSDKALARNLDAARLYRDRQRVKRQWSKELESWDRLGKEARRKRRHRIRQETWEIKARRMAISYILHHDNVSDEDYFIPLGQPRMEKTHEAKIALPKRQLERATSFFLRLLSELYDMEQEAVRRSKKITFQREFDLIQGNATRVEEYVQELEVHRFLEGEKRKRLQALVFKQPESWKSFDDETLKKILRIRGNVKHLSKLKKRDTIECRLEESFSKPLF